MQSSLIAYKKQSNYSQNVSFANSLKLFILTKNNPL